ncbi:T9SS type A sorting domain-containing protein [Luteibaculum oceani]|uniref:T9SS type A sorting domain-containing protein n=1 Tax=Luteibaculum oceani TaxID=1294296 RepID=A0A5C6VB71_9FLAO|nr:T9SS type A sorting domain-containing protein [Luteibaculum oceani]TXC81646.1 T9SS type A sorting domain-containing protein [Luteibaculum oceani]
MGFTQYLNFKAPMIPFFLGLFFISGYCAGQSTNLKPNFNFSVNLDGSTLASPFFGGFLNPQFSPCDYDADGTQDLFVFDRSNQRYYVLLKKNNQYVPQQISIDNISLTDWALLRDFNCDGIVDLFYGKEGKVLVREGKQSNQQIIFDREERILMSRYNLSTQSFTAPIFVNAIDIPLIEDSDGDGDLDIYSFSSSGTRVEFHKNFAMEENGSCDFDFSIESGCYGFFLESGDSGALDLGIEKCPLSVIRRSNLKHSGGTLFRLPWNGNLLLGELEVDELTEVDLVKNSANLDSAIATKSFLPGGTELPSFPSAYHYATNSVNKILLSSNSLKRNKLLGKIAIASFETDTTLLDTNYFLEKEGLDFGLDPMPFTVNGSSFIYARPSETNGTGSIFQLKFEEEAILISLKSNISTQRLDSLNPTSITYNTTKKSLWVSSGQGKLFEFSGVDSNLALASPSLKWQNQDGSPIYITNYDFDNNLDEDLLVAERNGDCKIFFNGNFQSPYAVPNLKLSLETEIFSIPKPCILANKEIWFAFANGESWGFKISPLPPYIFPNPLKTSSNSFIGRNHRLIQFNEGPVLASLYTGGIAPLHELPKTNGTVADIVVYPNPNKGALNFTVELQKLEIFDLQGKLIYKHIDNDGFSRLELSLNNGLYLTRGWILGQSTPFLKRIIIAHEN